MAWPESWDRGYVIDAILQATGVFLSPADPLPDLLIQRAQDIGIQPAALKSWIYEELPNSQLRYKMLTDALTEWANGKGLATEPAAVCAHCGKAVDTSKPEEHKCS